MDAPTPIPVTTTVDERDRGATVAVLPVGSFEQHGPHLPLATDTLIACLVAEAVAATRPVLRLPPVTISCSHEHADWAGTVSISASTLDTVVRDVTESLHRSGVTALVLINGHGGNHVLGNTVQEAGPRGRALGMFPTLEDWAQARAAAGLTGTNDTDMHAGELEISLLRHAFPDLVGAAPAGADHLSGDRRHLATLGLAPYSPSGVVGRPSLGTAEKGRAALAALVEAFAGCLDAVVRRRAGHG